MRCSSVLSSGSCKWLFLMSMGWSMVESSEGIRGGCDTHGSMCVINKLGITHTRPHAARGRSCTLVDRHPDGLHCGSASPDACGPQHEEGRAYYCRNTSIDTTIIRCYYPFLLGCPSWLGCTREVDDLADLSDTWHQGGHRIGLGRGLANA